MANLKVAVASCCSIENRPHQPAWDDIAAARPDVLLLLGDNVYMHKDEVEERVWKPRQLMRNYAAQFAQPQFARLMAEKIPTLVTWDDHDYGINDAEGAVEGDAHRSWTTALFDQWWHFRAGDRAGPVHCVADFDQVRFIVLDGRSWRERPGPQATPLGEEQERWLWAKLAEGGPPYTVVASGSTLRIGKPDTEQLANYRNFSSRLEEAMRARGRTIFVGGDLHYNAIRQGEGFVEIMTSGVAQITWSKKEYTNNWALLTFGEKTVEARFHGSDVKRPDGSWGEAVTIGPDWKITP